MRIGAIILLILELTAGWLAFAGAVGPWTRLLIAVVCVLSAAGLVPAGREERSLLAAEEGRNCTNQTPAPGLSWTRRVGCSGGT
jgi:hypothetical protein